jgi:predicted Fe-Mo cluster-binding NifX family protein
MRIAIPNWQGRISPVFDVAENIMLVDMSGNRVDLCQELVLPATDPYERAQLLHTLRTEILICCTLSRPHQMALVSAGIRVIQHICGQVEEVLEAITNGRFPGSLLMPGCRDRSKSEHLNLFLKSAHCKRSERRPKRKGEENRDV